MLFKVEMIVKLPIDMPKSVADDIKSREKYILRNYSHPVNGGIFGA